MKTAFMSVFRSAHGAKGIAALHAHPKCLPHAQHAKGTFAKYAKRA
jgi:hypothetical protein